MAEDLNAFDNGGEDPPAYMLDDIDEAMEDDGPEPYTYNGYLTPSQYQDENVSEPTNYENDGGTMSTMKGGSTLDRNAHPYNENGERLYDTPPDADHIGTDYGDDDEEAQRYGANGFGDDESDEYNGSQDKLQFKDKIDQHSTCKCVCLSILCFIALVLAVAIGMFVALFYFGALDKFRDDDDGSRNGTGYGTPIITTPMPDLTTLEALELPRIDMIDIPVQITLDQNYTDKYEDSSSPEYMQLENDITNMMDDTFSKDFKTMDIYDKTEVNGFKSGSILADILIFFKDSPAITKTAENENLSGEELATHIANTVRDLTFDIITAAADGGVLDGLSYVNGSLQVSDANLILGAPTTQAPTTEKPTTTRGPTTEPPPCTPGAQIACPETQADGSIRCIYTFQQCNGVDDCPKGSDEKECEACRPHQFHCVADDTCIDNRLVCNGENDCGDSSDEADCASTPVPKCLGFQFQCSVGEQCIYAFQECDGNVDCMDGSDEHELCQVPTTETSVQTTEGTVRTDEPYKTTDDPYATASPSTPAGPSCIPFVQFACASGDQCIFAFQECNGRENCDDGSDEVDCPGSTTEGPVPTTTQTAPSGCPEGMFDCPLPGGRDCIFDGEVCDGVEDCLGGADEADCSGPCNPSPCQNGGTCEEFEPIPGVVLPRCACTEDFNGQNCDVPAENPCESSPTPCQNGGICDFFPQTGYYCTCVGSYTGANCETQVDGEPGPCNPSPCENGGTCEERELFPGFVIAECSCTADFMGQLCEESSGSCQSQPCQNGGTCKADAVGDGYTCQCSQGYLGDHCVDEIVPCQPGEFQCHFGTCIPASQECNGYPECNDGSDELFCGCQLAQFRCDNGDCLQLNQICNGVVECDEGRDERYCGPSTTTQLPSPTPASCFPSEFACASGDQCIIFFLECDGNADCLDGSDEADCPNPCDSDPCMNGATCDPGFFGSYLCTCAEGYYGDNCEHEIGCQLGEFQCNNGECISIRDICNGPNDCIDGSDEAVELCGQPDNQCDPSPCLNGGSCEADKGTGYLCTCPAAYTGTNCEMEITGTQAPPQSPTPTLPTACYPFEFACGTGECLYTFQECDGSVDCADASDEANCQTTTRPVDPTVPSGCLPFQFACASGDQCILFFQECDGNTDCLDGSDEADCTSPCDTNPCVNGATCIDGTDGDYTCQCAPGYAGINCELELNECASLPCVYGTCIDNINSYSCVCPSGITGTNCEIVLDTGCASGPCWNGATCMDTEDPFAFKCACLPGYTGVQCETDLDECLSYPCQNGGVCNNRINQFTCTCPSQYTGLFCEQSVAPDTCSPLPATVAESCSSLLPYSSIDYSQSVTKTEEEAVTAFTQLQGISFCHENALLFMCGYFFPSCPSGNTYQTVCKSVCEEIATNCGPILSVLGAPLPDCSLFPDAGEGICEVQLPTTGHCTVEPCLNGATCEERGDSYLCTCAPGYSGVNCEMQIPAGLCSPDPCLNGGTCEAIDLLGIYICNCVPGFYGQNCQESPNTPCFSSPCMNGGSCAEEGGSYTCTCAAGYTGINCEQTIMSGGPCSTSPCVNGAACEELGDSYVCRCAAGYTGVNCDEQIGGTPCENAPCGDNGVCAEIGNTYYCTCEPGYTGINCEIDILECASFPCMNGGICADGVNDYFCICTAGYTGKNCETVVSAEQPCQSTPCMNAAQCVDDGVGGFTCNCQIGFTGDRCETLVDYCADLPCMNDAQCLSGQGGYFCICAVGYTGTNCETPTDPCSTFPCKNFGTCTRTPTGFKCDCTPGHEGPTCTQETEECASNPCQNGGICFEGFLGYVCVCAGYTGTHCETPIDGLSPCESTPCQNGAVCQEVDGAYTCTCLAGYTGVNCETALSLPCNSSPCENGGQCQEADGGYTCLCPVAYTGINCETLIDFCESMPCENAGTCTNLPGLYVCTCPTGFAGYNCELDIEPPTLSNCPSDISVTINPSLATHLPVVWGDVTATDNVGVTETIPPMQPSGSLFPLGITPVSYTFKDAAGNVVYCNFTVDIMPDRAACDSTPCMNGGICAEGESTYGYFCFCNNDYSGENCEIPPQDPCSNNLCQNGATCVAGDNNDYTCTCQPGYEGISCEIETDECAATPCQNGAACIDGINMYTCDCIPGYEGDNCEIDIDECAISPCMNGHCTDEINGYTCLCNAGWNGTNCDIDINECSSNPCVNGQCTDEVNGYTCTCDAGWSGVNCDSDCKGIECVNGQCSSNMCVCDPGWTGTLCDVDLDECFSNPCQNGGTCNDGINQFTCTCPEGYAGDTCEMCAETYLDCPDNSVCVSPTEQCDGAPHCTNTSAAQDEYGNAGCSYNCVLYQDYTQIECENVHIPYVSSFFPNYVTQGVSGFESVTQASTSMRTLYRERTCDRKALKFMCAATFPSCPFGTASSTGPCRSLCEELSIKVNCVNIFNDVGVDLAAMCERLPTIPVAGKDGLCTFH